MGAVWGAVDPEFKHRLGEVLDRVEARFLAPVEASLQASTIKNHVMSLRKFCNYAVIERSDMAVR